MADFQQAQLDIDRLETYFKDKIAKCDAAAAAAGFQTRGDISLTLRLVSMARKLCALRKGKETFAAVCGARAAFDLEFMVAELGVVVEKERSAGN